MKIIYTHTDEAPALATQSLLPILRAFTGAAGIEIELRDISLAARILAQFPDRLEEEQRVPDALAELGELVKTPEANVIKLPNISASVPQLKAAIAELQEHGYPLPDYPEEPADQEQREVRARYDRVKGSAVNPVIRQGNSDRRASEAVKNHARRHPHPMGEWSRQSRSHVSTMREGDFRSTERSLTVEREGEVRIEQVDEDGRVSVLREHIEVLAGDVLDAAVMRRAALERFLAEQIAEAREQGVLFSVHLKATMMRVSDPIIFGHAVRAYFSNVFDEHGETLRALGVNPNDGMAALLKAIEQLPDEQRQAVQRAIEAAYQAGPPLAMVDSERGITNLHVPSDVIIDASMPAAIRASGQMWNAQGEQQDTKFVIPDHSYAALYAETLEHEVQPGDIWRMCRTTDAAVQDWIRLAVARARETGWPAVFWLDRERPHDAQLLRKLETALEELDTEGLELEVLDVARAARRTLERARAGENTISVTGNVLRDYLTDLFPILELGTSAKMQSIVPLMAGGGLFETGAGGSAPRHVQQFLKENHLRWDSLGEFLALGPSLELLAKADENPRARLLARTLDRAIERHLEENRAPSRRVGELDNRGSHFYLALYWARELAEQSEDGELAAQFQALARRLGEQEERIVEELAAVQGTEVQIGGYYWPDRRRMAEAMRPSRTFNDALAELQRATA